MSTAHHTDESAGTGSRSGAFARPLRFPLVAGIVAAVAALVFVVDQLTKQWAERTLEHDVAEPALGNLLKFRLIYNSGAAFGMGSSATPIITCIQIAVAVAIVAGVIWLVRNPWWALSLALLLGGALGNIHDRLLRSPGPFHGYVVDFLELPHWPIFNVADIAVCAGAAALIALSFTNVPASAPAAGDDTAAGPTGAGRARPSSEVH